MMAESTIDDGHANSAPEKGVRQSKRWFARSECWAGIAEWLTTERTGRNG
jgi:hypothetical protein